MDEDLMKRLDSAYAWKPLDEGTEGFRFQDLSREGRMAVLDWIDENVTARKNVARTTSYGLKHRCERDVGFYVSNLQMKVAMRLQGHEPVNPDALNHRYRVYVSKRAGCRDGRR